MEALLHAHRHKIQGLDGSSWIDVKFMDHVCGIGGQAALELEVLSLLPTSTKEIGLEEALAAAKAVQESDLFRMASENGQGSVRAGIRLLDDVACRRRPEKSSATTTFLAKMWEQLPWFVSYQPKQAGKESKSASAADVPAVLAPLRGVAAIKQHWGDIKGKKDIDMDELKWIGPLAHVFDEDERKQIAQCMARILKSAPVRGAGKAKQDRQSGPKSKKPRDELDAKQQAARAVLGL